MDVRLNAEQRQLRDAAAKLADDLGPASVAELDDANRVVRLERAVAQTGWRSLRSDGASGVEVAIVAEEFGRGLVDVPFLGPVLADDLGRHVPLGAEPTTIAFNERAIDARGAARAAAMREHAVLTAPVGALRSGADLTRTGAELAGALQQAGQLGAESASRWQALALAATAADLVGTARGAHALACDYAKIREQYGKPIGGYQAIAHLLAEGLALIEGSVSVLRHAAWAVDEADAVDAVRAARIAKIYCARTARTVCETAIQVHGGIGNTWECLAHVYLRRALTSTGLWPVTIREIADGLS
ncbi:acyl-CoA dehydrogenase family protein [Mycolicibacter kumamotonensis]|uniref:Acyl-CoA dehydrogenase n=1 Tax=Mycolicibacter kumamotonensis TaxID=354243 RepID=A0A1B8SEA2_9MYCO|nr:acyl-CoA dehydrogenase family protein [Mycolicibacter kumamotonensis]OBY31070.1 acyl-CoA dehydrogenase [Mycolicibacter kumamotonensis]